MLFCGVMAMLKLLALTILIFVSYSPAINGGFIWDDDTFFTKNPVMAKPDALKRLWFTTQTPDYFPLVSTSLWLQRLIWGLHPMGYHIFNIILHFFNAVLLWLILKKMKIPGAWMAAAIFGIHPVNVESVAWITEIKNLQSTFFFMLTIFSYLSFVEKQKKSLYVFSLIFFLMALLSKTSVVMLPLLLLLYHCLVDGPLKKKDLINSVPFFVFSALFSLITIWFQYNRAGAMGEPWSTGFGERVAIAGRVVWFYIGKLIFPFNLMFVYPRWSINSKLFFSYLPVIALIALGFVLCKKRKSWGWPLLAGVGYFVINLFPVLGFFNIYFMRYSFVADHWQYIASPGIITLVVWAGIAVQDHFLFVPDAPLVASDAGKMLRGQSFQFYKHFSGITLFKGLTGFLMLLVLAFFTYQRSGIFQENFTLWDDTLKKNPKAWIAHNNIGLELEKQGKLEEAMEHYLETLRINPRYAISHDNLGLLLQRKGKLEESAIHFRKAIQEDPSFWESFNNLGYVLNMLGRQDEAVTYFQKALEINPYSLEAHNNLANIFSIKGEIEEAKKHYEGAMGIHYDNAEIHNNFGALLMDEKKYLEAMYHFRKALEIKPDLKEARLNLSIVLKQFGKNQKFQ